ncbi:MAG: electron transport complex subunit RsxC [Clostridia bacterium]|nr:electron transport complex subunit RsxC [Clostridia bacterium]
MLHSVHVPHRKHTEDVSPVRMRCPDQVVLPMSMHIGAPAKPVVQVGDHVKVGQVIAEAGGFVSAPIHASISGTVAKIEPVLVGSGSKVPAVFIKSDGLEEPWEGLEPPVVTDLPSFLDAVRKSGIVGLGGAGFPTSVKLTLKDPSMLENIVVNGAECEPYITSDTRTMIEDAEWIAKGARLLRELYHPKRFIVGVESNKPKAIKALKEALGSDGEVISLPSAYPQGGEKVLVYHTTGRIIGEGQLPIDAGAVVINCTTLAALMKYLETGMPLVSKCVTVDGGAVRTPMNVIAPIGTPIRDVFEFCGGFVKEPRKILYGGPMMGMAVPDTDVPVLKNTNALIALDEKEAKVRPSGECIHCGNCVNHCPLNLEPPVFDRAYRARDVEALKKAKVQLCMECGCCEFSCPALRPIVQTNKLAKRYLADELRKEKEKAAKG